MLNENPARRRQPWSQWTAGPLLTGSLAGALVVLSTMGALRVSASSVRHAGEPSEVAVNRTLNGDRAVATRMVRTIRFRELEVRYEPIVDVKLPEGCEPRVSACGSPTGARRRALRLVELHIPTRALDLDSSQDCANEQFCSSPSVA